MLDLCSEICFKPWKTHGVRLISDWHWSAFVHCWLLWTLALWVWESIAQFASVAPHFVLGMLNYQGLWFVGILVGGVVLRVDDVIWPFRALFYVVPYRYLSKAIFKTFFSSTPPYEGAELCDPTDPHCPLGFWCPGQSSLQGCFGVTGVQIMESLSHVYEACDPDASVAWNVAMVLVLTAAFKLLHYASLVAYCRS